MASVKFVFDSKELVIPTETDRSARLVMSGFRRKMEAGEEYIEVKGKDGVRLINAAGVNYIEVTGGGSSGRGKSKSGGRKPKDGGRKRR